MAQPSMPQQAQGHDDNDIKVGTRIESENTAVRQQIFDAMADMSWQEFESNFLESILEGLVLQISPSRSGAATVVQTHFARTSVD